MPPIALSNILSEAKPVLRPPIDSQQHKERGTTWLDFVEFFSQKAHTPGDRAYGDYLTGNTVDYTSIPDTENSASMTQHVEF